MTKPKTFYLLVYPICVYLCQSLQNHEICNVQSSLFEAEIKATYTVVFYT